MNLFFRFFFTWLFARFRQKIGVYERCSISFRVLPTDIDVLGHLNNGRYFSIADIARLDYLIRSNLFSKLSKRKVYPVVVSEMMRFKKSLNIFQRFELTTQLLGWDEKYFYLIHQFRRGSQIYALALIRGVFLHNPHVVVTSKEIAQIIGTTDTSPVLPAWIQKWQAAEQAFYRDNVKSD